MGSLNYTQRLMRDRVGKSQQLPPRQCDFDATRYCVDVVFTGGMTSRPIDVLAFDEEHAKKLAGIRLAVELVDLTTVQFGKVHPRDYDPALLDAVLRIEDAEESYDRKQEWERRQEKA